MLPMRPVEMDAEGFHFLLQGQRQFGVEEGEQARSFFDEVDVDAKDGEHAGVFAADHAAADDQEALRHLGQVEDGVGVEDALVLEIELGRAERIGAGGDEEDVAAKLLGGTGGGLHREVMGIGEGGVALEDGDLVPVEVVGDALAFAIDDEAFARHEVADGDGAFEAADVDAFELAVLEAGEEDGRFAEGLGGERAGVGRGAAEDGLFLDQGDLLAEVSGAGGAFFPGGAGPDHDEVEAGDRHEANSQDGEHGR
jgi:hypothetical protein